MGTKPNRALKADLLKLARQVGLFIPKQINAPEEVAQENGVFHLHHGQFHGGETEPAAFGPDGRLESGPRLSPTHRAADGFRG